MLSLRALLLCSAALSIVTVPAASIAATPASSGQDGAAKATSPEAVAPVEAAASGVQLETVVVTARKRSENVLTVPIAISAFTAADLAKRDIKTLSDIAAFTPGLSDDQSNPGGLRADRSFQALVIRGMYPSTVSNPTASVFINGVPVSADFVQGIDDLDRVEVLKGPQSAYFGRDTFAGAVNLTPASAGNKLTGDFSGELGARDTRNVTGAVTIPIIADKLSVRIGGSYDSHEGSYTNADNRSQTLGDQSSKSLHVAITARPVENLTIKAYGMMIQDNDGPGATGLLVSNGAYAQGNCTVSGTPFFCGALPNVNSAISPAANTTVTSAMQAFFKKPGGVVSSDQLVHGFGLKRDAYHGDVNVEYKIPDLGLTLNYLGGFSRDNWSEISDLSDADTTSTGQYPGYGGYAFAVEAAEHDFDHEFRISTDQSKPLRGLLGLSYVANTSTTASGSPIVGGLVTSDASVNKTAGIFFSLNYDVTNKLTLTYEGRYQSEKETSVTQHGVTDGAARFDDFLSRVSIQYKILPAVMAYATYSEGVNPGKFNTTYSTLPTVSQAEIQAAGLGGIVVQPEHLKNYELGVKGRFLNGRAQITADIYYDQWTNQLNAGIYNFAITDAANPYNVVGSSVYNANNTRVDQYNYTSNNASSIAKGAEVEIDLIPVKYMTFTLSGALTDTQYSNFTCSTGSCYPYTTTAYNAAGKYLPYSPRYSSNVGVEYVRPTELLGARDWFVRGDYIFRSGVYIDAANTARTPDYNQVNIRGGMHWDSFSVEGFVDNLTNTKVFTGAFAALSAGSGFTPTAVSGSLPQLITGGVRVKYHF
jgi:iron complex outermembrane receptor protein